MGEAVESSEIDTRDAPATPDELGADQIEAYLALIQVSDLLQHEVTQQLKADGGISHVQFQIVGCLLGRPDGSMRMTELADQIVYSRSGLTYQASLLEQTGLITRSQAPDDDRGVVVSITAAGRRVAARVMPGHIDLVREQLFDLLTDSDVAALSKILTRVRNQLRSNTSRRQRQRS